MAWTIGRGRQPEPSVGLPAAGLSARLASVRWPAGQGPYQYPWEPPRLAQGVPERTSQIRAIGNGIVWLQVYPIFAAIAEIEREEAEREGS